MVVFGSVLIWIGNMVHLFSGIFTLLVIGRVVASWMNADSYNPLVRLLVSLTEPLAVLVRKYIPPQFRYVGTIELTFFYALLVLQLIDQLGARSLLSYGLFFTQGS